MCTSNSDLNNRKRYPHGWWYSIDYKELDRKEQKEWERKNNPGPTRWFLERLRPRRPAPAR